MRLFSVIINRHRILLFCIAAGFTTQIALAEPPKIVSEPPADVVIALPTKTPFDEHKSLREAYLSSYKDGYYWAHGYHLQCPVTPAKGIMHASRGWVEGWQAGVRDGGEFDLPAKYAPYLVWREEVNPVSRETMGVFNSANLGEGSNPKKSELSEQSKKSIKVDEEPDDQPLLPAKAVLALINTAWLAKYYHHQPPTNRAIKVFRAHVPENAELFVGDQKVQISEEPTKDAIQITKVESVQTSLFKGYALSFRYPVEGVLGTVLLVQEGDDAWRSISISGGER